MYSAHGPESSHAHNDLQQLTTITRYFFPKFYPPVPLGKAGFSFKLNTGWIVTTCLVFLVTMCTFPGLRGRCKCNLHPRNIAGLYYLCWRQSKSKLDLNLQAAFCRSITRHRVANLHGNAAKREKQMVEREPRVMDLALLILSTLIACARLHQSSYMKSYTHQRKITFWAVS